jgi:putative FmdB family regulatory protein
MPLYEYSCTNGHIKKEIRSIHDDEPAQVICQECEQPMRQVIGGVAIKFKGGGFYTNDKRNR